jgi:hypothetical protein
MRRARRLGLALCSLGILFTCAWGTGCSAGCESDADCDVGERCEGLVFASCEVPECLDDDDCPAGYECSTFLTTSCEPSCEALECGRGTVCVEGMFGGASCVPGCKTNEDCPAQSFCPAPCWFCFSAPQCEPGCHDDAECGAGELCRDGTCRLQCAADSDCVNGVCATSALALLAGADPACPPGAQCACFACAELGMSVSACASADGGIDAH